MQSLFIEMHFAKLVRKVNKKNRKINKELSKHEISQPIVYQPMQERKGEKDRTKK